MQDERGWLEWFKLVSETVKKLDTEIDAMKEDITEIKINIAPFDQLAKKADAMQTTIEELRRYINDTKLSLTAMTEVVKSFDDLKKVRTDLAVLQAKSGIWGLVGGLIPAIGLLIYFLAGNIKGK